MDGYLRLSAAERKACLQTLRSAVRRAAAAGLHLVPARRCGRVWKEREAWVWVVWLERLVRRNWSGKIFVGHGERFVDNGVTMLGPAVTAAGFQKIPRCHT